MYSHVFVGMTDFDRALAFYAPLMAALGMEQRFCDPSRSLRGSSGAPVGGCQPNVSEHVFNGGAAGRSAAVS